MLHGAARPESRVLAVKKSVCGDERKGARRVCPLADFGTNNPIVQAYDINSLIALADSREVDLLKIDIETSEPELFSRNTDAWMPNTRNICIELRYGGMRGSLLLGLVQICP